MIKRNNLPQNKLFFVYDTNFKGILCSEQSGRCDFNKKSLPSCENGDHVLWFLCYYCRCSVFFFFSFFKVKVFKSHKWQRKMMMIHQKVVCCGYPWKWILCLSTFTIRRFFLSSLSYCIICSSCTICKIFHWDFSEYGMSWEQYIHSQRSTVFNVVETELMVECRLFVFISEN